MEFNNDYNLRRLESVKHALKKVGNQVDTNVIDLDIEVGITKEPVVFKENAALVYQKKAKGECWGELFDCGWFRLSGQLSKEDLLEALFLKFDVNGEGLLFGGDGQVLKGFTNGSSVFDRTHGEPGKLYYQINELIDEEGVCVCYLDCGANDLFGSLQENGVIKEASIVKRNLKMEQLYYDLETLISIQETDGHVYEFLMDELYELAAKIRYEEEDVLEVAEQLVKKYLRCNAERDFTFYAVGHAHIDLAWLWPIRETRRKAGRTLANVFHLIEKYDEFIFGISQPQMLIWLEKDYPDVFERIKKYVVEGRIEVQGGMWVEADTNITGEESLVRQMLYGKKYWLETFQKDVRSLWLPDVFGYNGAMPQIIRKSEMDYFMTIKLSWSLMNTFPYHTFNWHGIDGSDVLVHMPPEGNYNSSVRRQVIKSTYENYKEKDVSDEALVLYGIGDGGGGPGEEHLERIQRNNVSPGVKNIRLACSEDFFEKLNQKKAKYPAWHGELYLENHQGTYTSQGNIKKSNRQIENKLKMVETLLVSMGQNCFEEELEAIWKEVLLYQFHDILPGSSIKRVYDEALARYGILNVQLDEILEKATGQKLCETYDEGKGLFNGHGGQSRVYHFSKGNVYKTVLEPLSTKKVMEKVFQGNACEFTGAIKTPRLAVEFYETGEIKSIIDVEKKREVLTGAGNQLNIYKDDGNAWDIRDDYRVQTPLKWTLVNREYKVYGEIHVLIQKYKYHNSTLLERIMIDEEEKSIEFSHELDWQEMYYMMRSVFPLAVESNQAVFDIQFGHFSRSRQKDTRIEKAQFEVCGHNWVDVSEDGFGCALLNDGKYGYYIKDGVLDINLIRGTNYPAQDGDIGKTAYKYKLILHDGDVKAAGIDHEGQMFNMVYPIFEENLPMEEPIFVLDEAVAYSTIKHSWDRQSVVLRIYERNGEKTTTCIRTRLSYVSVEEVNMLENPVNTQVNLECIELEPFEIKTFLFRR